MNDEDESLTPSQWTGLLLMLACGYFAVPARYAWLKLRLQYWLWRLKRVQ